MFWWLHEQHSKYLIWKSNYLNYLHSVSYPCLYCAAKLSLLFGFICCKCISLKIWFFWSGTWHENWNQFQLVINFTLWLLECNRHSKENAKRFRTRLVLSDYASSEGSGVPAHPRSLARTSAARSYKQWVKRNVQTESQIPGPSEWLGMRSWNLSWWNAQRHKFAWRGSGYLIYRLECITFCALEQCDVSNIWKGEGEGVLFQVHVLWRISRRLCWPRLGDVNQGVKKSTINFPNIRTPKIFVVITLKIWTMWLYHKLMSPNDADGMANSVDPDQTAPLGAVWSGSALFAQAYLSENLGSLR